MLIKAKVSDPAYGNEASVPKKLVLSNLIARFAVLRLRGAAVLS
jgi:hypothetical protein